MPPFRVIFLRKNSKKGISTYNVWKKFQILSVNLLTQITNQKKTKSIDDFDLAWTKNPQLENGSHLSQNSPQNRILDISNRQKIPKRVLFFLVKNSRKGRHGDHKWHTPVRKYHVTFWGNFAISKFISHDQKNRYC